VTVDVDADDSVTVSVTVVDLSASVTVAFAIDSVRVSLSAIEPLADAGDPAVYPVPAAIVSVTVSVASTAVSSTGVIVIVADTAPAASVSVARFDESVPPTTDTL
jgi:hypothetical protein